MKSIPTEDNVFLDSAKDAAVFSKSTAKRIRVRVVEIQKTPNVLFDLRRCAENFKSTPNGEERST